MPGHVRDAHRDAARVDRLGELERTDDPRDEIRRHRDRRRRTDAHAAVAAATRVPISGPFEIASSPSATTSVIAKTALNSGSSKHGNARAGVRRLELGRREHALGAVVVDVGAAVEAEQAVG